MCALFSVMSFFLSFFGHLIATAVSPVEPEAHAERVWTRRQLDLDLRNLTVPSVQMWEFWIPANSCVGFHQGRPGQDSGGAVGGGQEEHGRHFLSSLVRCPFFVSLSIPAFDV